MAISNNLINTTDTDLYVSSGNSAVTVTYLCNTHTADVTVQVNLIPSGDGVAAPNQIYKDLVIPAGDTYVLDSERLILATGDRLSARADINTVVAATVIYVGI